MGLCASRQDVHVHNNIVISSSSSSEKASRSSSASGRRRRSKTKTRSISPSESASRPQSASRSRLFLRPRTSSVSPLNSNSSRSMDSLSPRPKTTSSLRPRNSVSPFDSSQSLHSQSFSSPRRGGRSIFISTSPGADISSVSIPLNTSSPQPKDTSSSQSQRSASPLRVNSSSSSISLSPRPLKTSSPKPQSANSSKDSSFEFTPPGSKDSSSPQPHDVSSPQSKEVVKLKKSSRRRSSKKGSRTSLQSRLDRAGGSPCVSSVYLDEGDFTDENGGKIETTCRKVVAKIKSIDDEMRDYVKSLLKQWEKSGLLEAIKRHARSTSKEMNRQLSVLAPYLTRKDTKYFMKVDDTIPGQYTLAKAFAIYFWISLNISFDNELWKQYISDSCSKHVDLQGCDILSTGRTNSLGYSTLFRDMAARAGIEAEIIEGMLSQVPHPALPDNMARTTAAVRHTWNAVSSIC